MALRIAGLGERGEFLKDAPGSIQQEVTIENAWKSIPERREVLIKVNQHVLNILRAFAQKNYFDSEKNPLAQEELVVEFVTLFQAVAQIRNYMLTARYEDDVLGTKTIRVISELVRPFSMNSEEGQRRTDLEPVRFELLQTENLLDTIAYCVTITTREVVRARLIGVLDFPKEIIWLILDY
jgi:hypothetical protein